ncbi:Protein-N(5)-glutamine methyltransferase PrmC, methylates polypeptide chain release factors RF1 and RF2 [hydrothermal vent metagenome]|uniref:peptide chain release factor N(5)-glutamine methyltransferase n=1 Tax=hydrothermal vent metagenome TaxID=652676 RepID=A0A1W1DES1_9ZZZZ
MLDKQKSYDIVDLGTGSGIIAVTLADKCPKWNLTATDYSYAALEVAKTNATTNINFQQGRWFDATPNQCFDLIISNPPYIEQGDPYLYDLTYEPQSALVSGKDGLDDIRIIVNIAPKYLNQDGYLLLEHGYNQQDIIEELLSDQFQNIQRFKDFNGQDRAILAQIK